MNLDAILAMPNLDTIASAAVDSGAWARHPGKLVLDSTLARFIRWFDPVLAESVCVNGIVHVVPLVTLSVKAKVVDSVDETERCASFIVVEAEDGVAAIIRSENTRKRVGYQDKSTDDWKVFVVSRPRCDAVCAAVRAAAKVVDPRNEVGCRDDIPGFDMFFDGTMVLTPGGFVAQELKTVMAVSFRSGDEGELRLLRLSDGSFFLRDRMKAAYGKSIVVDGAFVVESVRDGVRDRLGARLLAMKSDFTVSLESLTKGEAPDCTVSAFRTNDDGVGWGFFERNTEGKMKPRVVERRGEMVPDIYLSVRETLDRFLDATMVALEHRLG